MESDNDLDFDQGNPGTITLWIRDFRSGDNDAFVKIWNHYFPRLVVALRPKLLGHVARVCDSEDIASVTLTALHEMAASKRLPDVRDRHGMWRLLVSVANRKRIDSRRVEGRLKRGGGMDSAHTLTQKLSTFALQEVADCQPSPEELAIFEETFETMMSQLYPELRTIAALLLQGYSVNDVAAKLEVPRCVIDRKIKLIRTKWS